MFSTKYSEILESSLARGIDAMKRHNVVKEKSYSSSQSFTGKLKTTLTPLIAQYPEKSGFQVFQKGEDSFYARLALIQIAEKSIDLQYYAVANDKTSNIVLEAVYRSAERGVKVRLLVDGFTLASISKELLVLNEHENIEVRTFNPTHFVTESVFTKYFFSIRNAELTQRRMHNKALIADGLVAIIGGRNLGDEYFEVHRDISFKDVDILTAGEITTDISTSFDQFWNDNLSYPLLAVLKKNNRKIKAIIKKIKHDFDTWLKQPNNESVYHSGKEKFFDTLQSKLKWATAKFVADDPLKIHSDLRDDSPPFHLLTKTANKAEKEIIFVSSYFIPRKKDMLWFNQIRQKNIDIRILTNSLASTDVVAVHSGYQKCRIPLLLLGIRLYELKSQNGKSKQRVLAKTAPSKAGLHAKVYIIDNRYSLIGSFNFDPRSVNLNTELILLVDSIEIAQEIRNEFEETVSLQSSYHLSLNEQDNLVWFTEDSGKEVKHIIEPHAGLARRFQNFLFSFFPIEKSL